MTEKIQQLPEEAEDHITLRLRSEEHDEDIVYQVPIPLSLNADERHLVGYGFYNGVVRVLNSIPGFGHIEPPTVHDTFEVHADFDE